jgi:hypothetical protein
LTGHCKQGIEPGQDHVANHGSTHPFIIGWLQLHAQRCRLPGRSRDHLWTINGADQARIFDLVNAFTVTRDGVAVKSGTLHSSDRFQYVPSAVTPEGFTAQRLSDKQFRLINPYQNTMITWTCP